MTYTDATKLLELRLQMLGTMSPVKLLFGNREGVFLAERKMLLEHYLQQFRYWE